MGYEEIILLGVDFSYTDDKEKKCYSHFFDEKRLIARPATEWVYNAYLSAARFARENSNVFSPMVLSAFHNKKWLSLPPTCSR